MHPRPAKEIELSFSCYGRKCEFQKSFMLALQAIGVSEKGKQEL